MKVCHIFIIAFVLLAAAAPALADNATRVMAPYASAGTYGTKDGQIDTPLSVKVDADDNVYVLQQVHTGSARNRSVITVFSKNMSLLRSFDVLKTSMMNVGWDRAWSDYYYDDLASDFYITDDGMIYILCGWDVVVMDNEGRYKYQFPVSSFMGWISSTGSGDTQFYYPRGIVVTDDDYVVITSGNSPDKHEIILIYPDGKLFTKLETPVKNIHSLTRDRAGSLYVIGAGTNVVHTYDRSMTRESDMPLDLNGYAGNPASLAFFADGNISASANGISIYYNNGTVRSHFADYQVSENKNWGRPIATNSTGWLIVVSGMKDAAKTPKPFLFYKYDTGKIMGAGEQFQISMNMVLMAAIAVLALAWGLGAWYIIKNRR